MPAKSIKQQRFMGMVRRAQKTGQASSPEEFIKEEDYDRMKDRRMERGGVGGNQRYDRAPKANNTKKFGTGKTVMQKELEKKHGKGKSALDMVKAEIRAKHGKGAIRERADFWHPDPEKDRKLGGPGANQRAREDRAASKSSSSSAKSGRPKLKPGESYMQYAKRVQGKRNESVIPSFKSFLQEHYHG